ncbi:protein pelota [Nematocida sp. AWRm77]|nr:protein pelota [Nematocida sp. AWRm77]
MRVFARKCNKQETFLDVTPEDIDDIYALYRVVEAKDKVKSYTSRTVLGDDTKAKSRVSLLLEIQVEDVSVDLAVGILFLKGKILNETKYTKVGSFHTLEIPVHQRVSITKEEASFSVIEMLRELTLENKAETAYVLCRKDTYAVVLSSQYTTKRVSTVPREKNKGGREKVVQQILRSVKDGVLLLVVIGEDKEFSELFKKAPHLKNKTLFIKKAVTAENTYKGDGETLDVILKMPDMLRQMAAMKYGKEVLATNEFFAKEEASLKGTSTGQKEVLCAAENYLIKKLILVDACVKSSDPKEREGIEHMVSLAKQCNAEVFILSQHTPSGEKVLLRGGVVAILSQPVLITDLME